MSLTSETLKLLCVCLQRTDDCNSVLVDYITHIITEHSHCGHFFICQCCVKHIQLSYPAWYYLSVTQPATCETLYRANTKHPSHTLRTPLEHPSQTPCTLKLKLQNTQLSSIRTTIFFTTAMIFQQMLCYYVGLRIFGKGSISQLIQGVLGESLVKCPKKYPTTETKTFKYNSSIYSFLYVFSELFPEI